jgi:homoserine O-acetyltransferase
MDTAVPFPEVEHRVARFADGLMLDSGQHLPELAVAYETYGRLDAARRNAVLVCHALTGDQYVAGQHPVTGRSGWWEGVVGPGLPVDTDRYFVVCANVLGGCMGSTGPRSAGPDGEPWGPLFPSVTIRDMVRAQARLVEHLGIERLLGVVGGSMGGMQVLDWAATYPERVGGAAVIASAPLHSAQNIAFHEVGRQAVIADPDWHGGHYAGQGTIPARGLAVARMAAHITYVSEEALARKFGRRLREGSASLFGDQFEVESYLNHQGSTFVQRFDANSYLTITRAMDLFDLAAEHDGELSRAFAGAQAARTRFLVVSFSSDWLFPTAQSRAVVRALTRAGANTSFVEIATDKGHDAFLLDEPAFHQALGGFLAGCAERAGVA